MQMFRVIVVLLSAFVCNGCEGNPQGTLPEASITVIAANAEAPLHIDVEIASTPLQRQKGLMARTILAENRGMLFLYANDSSGGYWMHNTLLPLTIAYIGADGTIQELRDGQPLDETVLTPAKPYRYVLEMNQGWFERHNVGVGDRVELPPGLPAAQ